MLLVRWDLNPILTWSEIYIFADIITQAVVPAQEENPATREKKCSNKCNI